MRALALLSFATFAIAADHADGPALAEDPAADILDIYTFVSPNDAARLVLVMTVHPFATVTSRFSPRVDYIFHVEQNTGLGDVFDFRCRFDDRAYTCIGPDGLEASGTLDAEASDATFRVWAGLADNPYFFDREAFAASRARLSGEAADGPGLCGVEGGANGRDFYAGTNALAIVLEFPSALVSGGGETPQLLVWGRTVRR